MWWGLGSCSLHCNGLQACSHTAGLFDRKCSDRALLNGGKRRCPECCLCCADPDCPVATTNTSFSLCGVAWCVLQGSVRKWVLCHIEIVPPWALNDFKGQRLRSSTATRYRSNLAPRTSVDCFFTDPWTERLPPPPPELPRTGGGNRFIHLAP